MEQKNKQITSLCCDAPVGVVGKTTKWYECTKCEMPCDIGQLSFMGSASSTTLLPDAVTTRLNRLERMVIMQGLTIMVLVVTMLLVAWG